MVFSLAAIASTLLAGIVGGFGQLISKPIMEYMQSTGYFDIDTYTVVDTYCEDMIKQAKEGKLQSIVCRDKEINKILDILNKNGKGNPCLVGKAGVGKTAIVKGLAVKIANGDVPDNFKNRIIYNVKMVELVQGKGYNDGKGAINRIRALFDFAKRNPNVILFIDEIHQVSGVAELCKTYLADGSVHLMGATTLSEYNATISKDPALERRFDKVQIDETSPEDTEAILQNMKPILEKNNNVIISDEAIKAAVNLTDRYMKFASYPDKAIVVLERAVEKISKDKTIKPDNGDKVTMVSDHICQAISDSTNLPVGKISKEEMIKLATMHSRIKEYLVGQDHAVKSVCDAVYKGKVDFRDPKRPIESFLFTGPSGSGKTYLAEILGEEVGSLVRLDMSQYAREYSLMDLVGSKSHGFKGELTERILEKPYSVILLDGIEKAHPSVRDALLGAMENGFLTDSAGQPIDFRNTIIIMTSDVGADKLEGAQEGQDINKDISDAILQKFGRSFIDRVDNVILFNKLQKEDLKQITKIFMKSFAGLLESNGISLSVDDEVISNIADMSLNARDVRRAIQNQLQKGIYQIMMYGNMQKGQTICIDIKDGKYHFSVK